MMCIVLLLLNKFEFHCPVLYVVITHPCDQDVFDVTVGSFYGSLALWISRLSMNHYELRLQLFELFDDIGCKFLSVFTFEKFKYFTIMRGFII